MTKPVGNQVGQHTLRVTEREEQEDVSHAVWLQIDARIRDPLWWPMRLSIWAVREEFKRND